MLVIEHGIKPHLMDESQFTWHSYDPSDENPEYDEVETLRVHPWHRSRGTKYESWEVAVQIRRGPVRDGIDDFEIVIVDRDEFVAGLLAVLPEIQRNPDYEG